MPSSWDTYYVVFLSALLSLGIPAALGFISLLVSPRSERRREVPQKLTVEKSNHTVLGQRINVRFFLAANAALILLALGVILIPCVGAFQASDASGLPRALISIVTITGFAAL